MIKSCCNCLELPSTCPGTCPQLRAGTEGGEWFPRTVRNQGSAPVRSKFWRLRCAHHHWLVMARVWGKAPTRAGISSVHSISIASALLLMGFWAKCHAYRWRLPIPPFLHSYIPPSLHAGHLAVIRISL